MQLLVLPPHDHPLSNLVCSRNLATTHNQTDTSEYGLWHCVGSSNNKHTSLPLQLSLQKKRMMSWVVVGNRIWNFKEQINKNKPELLSYGLGGQPQIVLKLSSSLQIADSNAKIFRGLELKKSMKQQHYEHWINGESSKISHEKNPENKRN